MNPGVRKLIRAAADAADRRLGNFFVIVLPGGRVLALQSLVTVV